MVQSIPKHVRKELSSIQRHITDTAFHRVSPRGGDRAPRRTVLILSGVRDESLTCLLWKFIVPGRGFSRVSPCTAPGPLGRGRRPEAGRGGGNEEGPAEFRPVREGACPLPGPHPPRRFPPQSIARGRARRSNRVWQTGFLHPARRSSTVEPVAGQTWPYGVSDSYGIPREIREGGRRKRVTTPSRTSA